MQNDAEQPHEFNDMNKIPIIIIHISKYYNIYNVAAGHMWKMQDWVLLKLSLIKADKSEEQDK